MTDTKRKSKPKPITCGKPDPDSQAPAQMNPNAITTAAKVWANSLRLFRSFCISAS